MGAQSEAGQPGSFDLDQRDGSLSSAGDPLERLAMVVDGERLRAELEAALERSERAKGGRPPYDPVLMFEVLVLQTLCTLSDDRTESQLNDRLACMRFVGLALEDRVPDATTLRLLREQPSRAGGLERRFARFDRVLRAAGHLAMGGQIVDATSSRRAGLGSPGVRRRRSSEKATIKGGGVPSGRSKAKRAPMGTEGRRTLERGRKRSAEPSAPHERTRSGTASSAASR